MYTKDAMETEDNTEEDIEILLLNEALLQMKATEVSLDRLLSVHQKKQP